MARSRPVNRRASSEVSPRLKRRTWPMSLKYGSLPLSFQPSESETVSATLGLASLRAGLLAGALGLAVVFVYCLFYYRALGVLTILSLALSGLIVYAVLVLLGRWIGFTLDLAGVAGFIVAIGITADSFVIFFERLRMRCATAGPSAPRCRGPGSGLVAPSCPRTR